MAVCANGTDRETIERDPGTGNWWPAVEAGQPWPVTDGHTDHGPALMTTIELIRPGYPPATCQWCAWPTTDGALYLLGGKGCCGVHVERALREITTKFEADGIVRHVLGESIPAQCTCRCNDGRHCGGCGHAGCGYTQP